ncbi:enoyl-[acyl-carrier-protein] reductase FabV [Streptomyces sp. NBC_00513]|uniref:enoyl-[acyl-carrier-protein] reductase FabV n=1 Tax=unclassified Streptomyces TaxID=2593676 RepID=UPI0022538B1A|nr:MULTISPECIES: enoyl-[acyl-carrier-protein] reductase FabV [unclassified Streptomyces]MCX5071923.1 enoyl-[acyl-carrier-protein] reductase FabV [Streptomyces sp. NBC_00424]MCX5157641.1 enoyl-[acyl-carrier-protein] reductase FabV [Streptomyces sp. NBC_00291]WUD44704.1 enoyl-[acyl-carrier-protein] reductase FabV [Streptomyces sp. NBC_00513]
MRLREIKPGNRGYLYVNSHPTGCRAVVDDMWRQTPDPTGDDRPGPVTLVIGSSAGYGLAATLVGLRTHRMRGLGIAFESPATERRTAGAGWYRTARTAELAAETGADFTFLNGDAFSDEVKDEAVDQLAARFGKIDLLVYSIAAPRRTDPVTGEVHHSVIKPIGTDYRAKTLVFEDGVPQIGEMCLRAADEAEREATVQVMGGTDWRMWIDALRSKDLLADGFRTVALSYVGSDITAPIYRAGTIGAAKQHLEDTARAINTRLQGTGHAHTVVAGAAVTQASTAIPSIALYTGILHRVAGDSWQTTVDQAAALWNRLAGDAGLDVDDQDRVRLDDWEMNPEVQAAVRAIWDRSDTDSIAATADTAWFRDQVGRLYGWNVPGVDYEVAAETTVPWPTPAPCGI